ncbi:MAG: hypothetical protein TREMPRED_000149 [Tremellales sp. Tagirdzhanova-0007]|nr:MAG: hypothetical protein TREMPRED_000149 [Tremellales sp. Tagirdzhanova-0007]
MDTSAWTVVSPTNDMAKNPPHRSLRRHRYMLVALMLSMMLCGWAEGSIGPLLPSLQLYYGVNYTILSLIWMTNFFGGLIAGFTNVFITDRFGFGWTFKAAPMGALLQSISYGLLALGWPFGVFLGAFGLNGFGLTMQDAQVNNITSRLPTASSSVFHVQACFAIGATIGPFFSTAFAQSDPTRPYLFFWVPAGVALLTAMQMLHACRGVKEEQFGKSWIDGQTISRGQYGSTGVAIPAQGDQRSFSSTNGSTGESQVLVSSKVVTGRPQSSWGKMSRILTSRAAYLLMAWSFFNSGAEVTISSFLTSYLIEQRGASASAGQATTGFWAAMTLSRLFFVPINNRLGYSNATVWYSGVALVAQVVIALSTSLITIVTSFCIVGLMFGPMYPNALMVASLEMEDDLRGGVIGLMGSFGSAGGAFFPM